MSVASDDWWTELETQSDDPATVPQVEDVRRLRSEQLLGSYLLESYAHLLCLDLRRSRVSLNV